MSSLLVIEDDPRLSRSLINLLGKEKFVCDVCRNGDDGYRKALDNVYDLILLDWSLPNMDGEQVLRTLRKDGVTTPVLVLTARTDSEDAAKMLDSGADDYIRKSFFNGREFVARVKNLIRNKEGRKTNMIEIGDLKIDLNNYLVYSHDELIELDNMDFRILACLASNSPNVVSPEDIVRSVWGDYDLSVHSGTIRAHVCFLRKKLEKGKNIRYIQTVHGRGFKLEEEKSEEDEESEMI